MKLEPNEKRLVVEKIEAVAEPMSKGGIHLPDGSSPTKSKSRTGKVVAVPLSEVTPEGAVGKFGGLSLDQPRFSVGDVVVFDKHAGTDVSVDGTDYLILHFDDVLVKIK